MKNFTSNTYKTKIRKLKSIMTIIHSLFIAINKQFTFKMQQAQDSRNMSTRIGLLQKSNLIINNLAPTLRNVSVPG